VDLDPHLFQTLDPDLHEMDVDLKPWRKDMSLLIGGAEDLNDYIRIRILFLRSIRIRILFDPKQSSIGTGSESKFYIGMASYQVKLKIFLISVYQKTWKTVLDLI